MPAEQDMPSTLRRSPKKAQQTWSAVHDSAVETYGEGERAHRTAFAALKHEFEKVGDHWEPKGHKGPSDPRAKEGGREAREGQGADFGGVDYYGRSRDDLARRAKEMGVRGTSHMRKADLARAIEKKNDRATAKARGD